MRAGSSAGPTLQPAQGRHHSQACPDCCRPLHHNPYTTAATRTHSPCTLPSCLPQCGRPRGSASARSLAHGWAAAGARVGGRAAGQGQAQVGARARGGGSPGQLPPSAAGAAAALNACTRRPTLEPLQPQCSWAQSKECCKPVSLPALSVLNCRLRTVPGSMLRWSARWPMLRGRAVAAGAAGSGQAQVQACRPRPRPELPASSQPCSPRPQSVQG